MRSTCADFHAESEWQAAVSESRRREKDPDPQGINGMSLADDLTGGEAKLSLPTEGRGNKFEPFRVRRFS